MRKILENSNKTKEHMSFIVIVPKNVLSEGIKKIMASSGLNFDHLKLAHRRGGIQGLRVVGEIQRQTEGDQQGF